MLCVHVDQSVLLKKKFPFKGQMYGGPESSTQKYTEYCTANIYGVHSVQANKACHATASLLAET